VKRTLTVLMLALVMTAMLAVTASMGFAKITTVTENPGGNQPPGQQDEPKGNAMETFAENPAGHRPPGQQP
jgi:hypothetical protein